MANWTSTSILVQDDRPVAIEYRGGEYPALSVRVGGASSDDAHLTISLRWNPGEHGGIVRQLRETADAMEAAMQDGTIRGTTFGAVNG